MKPDPAGREPDAGVRRLSCTGKRPQRAQIAEQEKERKPCCANGPENRQNARTAASRKLHQRHTSCSSIIRRSRSSVSGDKVSWPRS